MNANNGECTNIHGGVVHGGVHPMYAPKTTGPAPTPAARSSFELQIFERLSRIERNLIDQVNVKLTAVSDNVTQTAKQQVRNNEDIIGLSKQVSHLQTSLNTLQKKVEDRPVEPIKTPEEAATDFFTDLTGLTPDVPDAVTGNPPPAAHETLTRFSLERFVRVYFFKKVHPYNNTHHQLATGHGPRGPVEVRRADFIESVDDATSKMENDQLLELLEDYIAVFLRKRKFENKSFAKKYPLADFKRMNTFLGNVSKGLNKILNLGVEPK